MAIVFELVLNYGQNHAAIEDARRVVAAHPPLPAGPYRVALHEPLVDTVLDAADQPFLEMSIIPVGVGHNVAIDRHSRVRLTPEELDELGVGLYGLLAKLSGYQLAMVGWDPEWLVDPVELQREYADRLQAGTLYGLVVAETVQLGVPMPSLVPFADGFLWFPFRDALPSF
ncbi:hypothetical protein [Actinomadura sp. NPDC048394]|uniref:hypothetical protein n=1 Tax=Actinomadura sp. NPDC048394 TaxID=3158223 RepID=UPI0033E8B157